LRWQILAAALPDRTAAAALLAEQKNDLFSIEGIASEIALEAAIIAGDHEQHEQALTRRLTWLLEYGLDGGLALFRSVPLADQDALVVEAGGGFRGSLRLGLAAAAALEGDLASARSFFQRWRRGPPKTSSPDRRCEEIEEPIVLAAAAEDAAVDPYELLASE